MKCYYSLCVNVIHFFFFFQAEDGIRDKLVNGVQTCALPICSPITRGRKWVFSGMTLYDRQSRMMIDYLVGRRKVRTFAALYQDDEYGKAFLTAFEKDLR